jgi:RNA polymerase sigma-70 factor (ECF subfamily)
MNDIYRERISELYLELYNRLMIFARNSLESESLAEEAVQEAFRIVCQKPEALFNSPNPQGWLVLTLKNTIRNIRRNRATAKRIVGAYLLEQVESVAVHEDTISLKMQYQDLADSEEFKLLYEMAIEGRSHTEMAQARGITVSACKKRVQRAKELLKKKMTI